MKGMRILTFHGVKPPAGHISTNFFSLENIFWGCSQIIPRPKMTQILQKSALWVTNGAGTQASINSAFENFYPCFLTKSVRLTSVLNFQNQLCCWVKPHPLDTRAPTSQPPPTEQSPPTPAPSLEPLATATPPLEPPNPPTRPTLEPTTPTLDSCPRSKHSLRFAHSRPGFLPES